MEPNIFGQHLLRIYCIAIAGKEVRLIAEPTSEHVLCPKCKQETSKVHSFYRRKPMDLPWGGWTVRLIIRARRFRCQNQQCQCQLFTERFPGIVKPYARRTEQATEALIDLAVSSGGELGSRLAKKQGLPTSPATLLRLLRAVSEPAMETPRVLGIDDLALRKGSEYATLLCDLEAHRPVDLLLGRDAVAVRDWLRDHPGVQIVVRDRAQTYAQGAKEGAPKAIQIADRWHLIHNASDAMDELQRQRRREGSPAFTEPYYAADGPKTVGSPEWQELFSGEGSHDRLEKWRLEKLERWEKVRQLRQEGKTIKAIAQQMRMGMNGVSKCLKEDVPPTSQTYPACPRKLSPFIDYLRKRWEEGCRKGTQLHREIKAQGYSGSAWSVRQVLAAWRDFDRPWRAPPTKGIRWLVLRPADQLSNKERQILAQVLAADPLMAKGHRLMQGLRKLVGEHAVMNLKGWLSEAKESGVPPFEALAQGIEEDIEAVRAALIYQWSTGPVEGEITKVKLLKRQGYGRAKLDLLRKRVLLAA